MMSSMSHYTEDELREARAHMRGAMQLLLTTYEDTVMSNVRRSNLSPDKVRVDIQVGSTDLAGRVTEVVLNHLFTPEILAHPSHKGRISFAQPIGDFPYRFGRDFLREHLNPEMQEEIFAKTGLYAQKLVECGFNRWNVSIHIPGHDLMVATQPVIDALLAQAPSYLR